ncbi:MAG: hypothetical protein NXH75_01035 [Halobacteriovoraceae bacterium]|nr:hypothetical protein [Halobacteriovoraceae bacterium]
MEIQEALKDGDIIDHEAFRSLIPKDVYDLLVEVSREGFSLTLVGGAVRDWLLTGNLPHDLDFELRHTFDYEEKDWSFRVNRLGERLREIYRYQVEFLSFSILRITWPDSSFDVELGPSRLENYRGDGPFGHSDFEASLVSSGKYSDTFQRRDFTFNALGIEFRSPGTPDEFAFVDPYGGREDLKKKVVVPCSESCHKDPVRFCRAIRFKNKLGLSFSEEMNEKFSQFNLSKLSLFYFFREAFKCDFFGFTHDFFEIAEANNVVLSEEVKDLSFLKNVGERNLSLHNESEILMYLIYKDGLNLKEENILSFLKHSKSKEALLKTHRGFKETLKKLDELGFKPDSFLKQDFFTEGKQTLEGRVEALAKDPCFLTLKKYHQVVSRQGKNSFAVMGRMNSHLYALFLKTYDILPASLEGKEIYSSFIKEFKGVPENRGHLEYLAHFQKMRESHFGD